MSVYIFSGLFFARTSCNGTVHHIMIINGRNKTGDIHQKLLPKPHSQLQASSPHSNTQQRNTLKSQHFISVAHSCPLICKSPHLWVASKASKLEQSGTLPSKESDNWERTLSGGEGCVCVCVCWVKNSSDRFITCFLPFLFFDCCANLCPSRAKHTHLNTAQRHTHKRSRA